MFKLDGKYVDINNAKNALFVLNQEDKLSFVLIEINNANKIANNAFDYFYKILNKKYKTIKRVRPFVGNMYARLGHDGDLIELSEPDLSFTMKISYATNQFHNLLINKNKILKRKENNVMSLYFKFII